MRPAAKHAEIAIAATQRVRLLASFIRPMPVEAPLGHVAMHVVQAPRIRRCLRYTERWHFVDHAIFRRHRLAPGEEQRTPVVIAEPLLRSRRQGIAAAEQGRRARTAGILPLRLRRQPIGAAFLLREPRAKRRRLMPTHLRHRLIVRRPLLMLRLKLPILPHRHLRHPEMKRLRDSDPMRWSFIEVRELRLLGMLREKIIRRRPILPHDKTPRRNRHELHADGVRDGLGRERCGDEEKNEEESHGSMRSLEIGIMASSFAAWLLCV